MTTAPPEAPLPGPRPADRRRLDRFDAAERALHWVNAAFFVVLSATAAALYLGPLSAIVGRRGLVRQVHVVAGLLLPVPLLVAWLGPWRAGLRSDLRALNRWGDGDRRWLRSWGRDRRAPMGKFHPGQKLNAAFTAGALGVLLLTGAMLHWFRYFPLDWRTGATFVHDWAAIAAFVAVVGHVGKALRDGDALRAIVRGWVPADWARRHRRGWFEEATGEPAERG